MRNPSPPPTAAAPLRFGRFELRPDERVLLADGVQVPLGTRAFDVLALLASRPGALVRKDELLATVWAGLVVEENNLQVQVSTLRKVLGQSALATVPGRGYRFDLPIAHAQATDGAPPLAGAAALAGAGADGEAGARTNLPPRLPLLYGRSDDVAAIARLLRRHAVVTITGAGGIGKTRVAQAVARQFATEHAADYPDGVWWVELAPLADGALVASAVAQAMGMRLAVDRPASLALRAQLAGRRALIVLDNCEHLADAVAALVDSLAAGVPHLTLLVTSQETLRAGDEHVYRLGALAVPPAAEAPAAAQAGAVELFDARARAVDPHFSLAANLAVVVEICRRLDGIPLAIELAAARLPLLGVHGLRARLHERFNLLTGGARVVLRRHQTLRATLEWSHGLLTPDEQTVFRRLSVFAGGFTLEAAQHVGSDERIDPWVALDHLGALVDKSLVIAEGDAVPRYRMLETTRVYGLERLGESGETDAILRRHAEAILAVLEPFDRDEWQWRASGEWHPAARAELDNLRAAWEWVGGAPDGAALALALAGVSYSVWWSSFHLAEGLARCIALRHRVDASVPAHVAARFWLTLTKLGLYSLRRESYDAAVRAAALYRELGDAQRCYDALCFAAVQGTRFATAAQTEAHLAEAAALEQPDWPARQRACLQFARCWWLARQDRLDEALEAARLQADICREGGAEVASLYAVSNVTSMELLLGRPRDALEHASAAIARLHALRNDGGAGHLYANETMALMLLGRLDEALQAARHAYPRLLEEGDANRLLAPQALLHALRGRVDTALRLLGFEDAAAARTGEHAGKFSVAMRARLEPLLRGLAPEERARLAAEGAALDDEQAFELALCVAREGDTSTP